MSYSRIRAVNASALTSTQKQVANAVLIRADDDDGCFASAETLGRDCSLNERTVRLTLKELADLGVLLRQERNGRSAVYRFGAVAPRPATPERTPGAPDPAPGVDVVNTPERRSATPDPGSATPERTPGAPDLRSDDLPLHQPPRSAPSSAPPPRKRARGTLDETLFIAAARSLHQRDHKLDCTDREQIKSLVEANERGVTADEMTLVWDYFHGSRANAAKLANDSTYQWFRSFKAILNPQHFVKYLAEATAWDKRGRTDEIPVGRQHPNTGRWDNLAAETPETNDKPFIDVEFTTENGHGVPNGSSNLFQALARRRPAG